VIENVLSSQKHDLKAAKTAAQNDGKPVSWHSEMQAGKMYADN